MPSESTPYDPDRYWEDHGGPVYREYTESPRYSRYQQAQSEFFSHLVKQFRPQRLLDFGCGTGKLFPLWVDIPEVHGYDRARSQIEVARAEAARIRPANPYRLMHYAMPGRASVPYDDDDFDLVIVAEVLLHVLPSEISSLITELQRICRSHLAIVTAAPFENPAPHNFNHDYSSLLAGRFEIIDDHCLYQQRYLLGKKLPIQQTNNREQMSLCAHTVPVEEHPDAVIAP